MDENDDLNLSDDRTSESSSGTYDATLNNLGIKNGQRYETIVTTNGPHLNAAAMGIQRFDDKFKLKIFEMSNTFENIQNRIKENGTCLFGINIIDAAQLDLICYAALRGWGSPIPEFSDDYYERIQEIPILRDAHANIICEPVTTDIEKIKDQYGQSSRMILTAQIVEVVVNNKESFQPLVRGPDEPLLDALVFATKFKIARGQMKDKCRNRVEELLERAGKPRDPGRVLTMEALQEYFGIF